MKPLFLKVEGINNKEKQTFDLTTQTANLSAVYNQDLEELKRLLSLGFYGGGKEGLVELVYEYNGENYTVLRDFTRNIAELSLYNTLICQGVTEVDKQIYKHIKMDQRIFEKLVIIDRDKIFDGFMLPAKEREKFLDSYMEGLVPDKTEISTIEKNIKEKYQKTEMQLELIEEVDPKELADLKAEIKDKTIIRQDMHAEIESLNYSIKKGEEINETLKAYEQEKKDLEKALAKQPLIEELNELLEKSNKAEIASVILQRKQELTERHEALQKRQKELEEEIQKDNASINKGKKSVKEREKVLIHCLERLAELRKFVSKRIKALNEDGDFQQNIKEQIEKLYQKEEEEFNILSQKKVEVEEEIEAVKKAYNDISKRLEELHINSDTKKAIREGAILETEMKKLNEEMAEIEVSIEINDKKLAGINAEIERKRQQREKIKLELIDINNFITGTFADKDEAIKTITEAEQSLYKNSIVINIYEQEIEAIEEKIRENRSGMESYKEDMEALNSAKEGLNGYIEKLKSNIKSLEEKLTELKVNDIYTNQIQNIEYGQQCPICDAVVLKKKETKSNERTILQTSEELKKAKDALDDYENKLVQLNKRTGELNARIKISETYIRSLEESIRTKKEVIKNILNDAKCMDTNQLAEKHREMSQKMQDLKKAINDYDILQNDINKLEEDINALKEEKRVMEEEQVPHLIERRNNIAERLKECEKDYAEKSKQLKGISANEKLNELTLSEKESDTLRTDLFEKRQKLDELIEEKMRLDELAYFVGGRKKNKVIKGKEYDYQTVIIKVIGKSIEELLDEIKKSEEEIEELKIELLAVKKVLNSIIERNTKNTNEYENIKTKIISDKEILDKIISDYEDKINSLNISNVKEIKRLILSEERKQDIKDEIKEYNNNIAIHKVNAERMEKMIKENSEFYDLLDEHRTTYKNLVKRYEQAGQDISNIAAKRAEMKSKAKQRLALKEKLIKYNDKLKVLKDVIKVVSKNENIPKFIIKFASKRLYSLTKGKYNLDIIEDKLALINNSEGGKIVERENYTNEEKLLVSLLLGTSLHRMLIDMIGGETMMLIFPLKEKETDREIAVALATYAKKKALMIVAKNKSILDELSKLA